MPKYAMRFERNDCKIDSRTRKPSIDRTGNYYPYRTGTPLVKAGQEIVRDWSDVLRR